jgi:iron complex transport system substrate-binding protein
MLISIQPRVHAAGAPAYRTVVDMAGRRVRLKSDIKRIVLIRGRDIYELSALLGSELPSKLTAWGSEITTSDTDAYDKFCQRYPRLRKTPLIASGNGKSDICGEQLVSLRPDIVIADRFMRIYPAMGKFERMGLPIFYLDQNSDPMTTPQASLLALGDALGKQARASQIVAFVNQRYQLVSSRLSKIKTIPPSIYLEAGGLGRRGYDSTYGGRYGFSALLAHARSRNIAAQVVPEMAPISAEFMLKSNPDVIVISGANWLLPDAMRLGYCATLPDSQRRLKAFTTRPGWNGLKAVKNKRVYAIFHGFAMHIFDFAGYEYLAKALYPNQFKDLNPDADLKLFHKKFMPIDCTGVWMTRLQ